MDALNPKQIESLAEYVVIYKRRRPVSDCRNRYIIDNCHDCRKNRQCKETICHDPVNLIRYADLSFFLSRVAITDNGRDIHIAFIRNDTFHIVVKGLLQLPDLSGHIRRTM